MFYEVTWYPIHGRSEEDGATEHLFKECSKPESDLGDGILMIEFTCDGCPVTLIGGSCMITGKTK